MQFFFPCLSVGADGRNTLIINDIYAIMTRRKTHDGHVLPEAQNEHPRLRVNSYQVVGLGQGMPAGTPQQYRENQCRGKA